MDIDDYNDFILRKQEETYNKMIIAGLDPNNNQLFNQFFRQKNPFLFKEDEDDADSDEDSDSY